MPTERTPRPGDSYVQAFARGLSVIRAFGPTAPRMTLTQVARKVKLSRAGARRSLLTLQALGYADANGREFYLTPKVLELGAAFTPLIPPDPDPKTYIVTIKSRRELDRDIPEDERTWVCDVCAGQVLYVRDATHADIERCTLAEPRSRDPLAYFCELRERGALVDRRAVATVEEEA